MKSQMDEVDREILRRVQDGIPLEARPFSRVAKALSIGEAEVVGRLESLIQRGVVRRFGSRVNHRKAGIAVNAMVVWKVPPERVAEVGTGMAGHPEVTHCYERRIHPGRWEYNLYTVIHGQDRETICNLVERFSRHADIDEFLILTSTREFKRTPAGRIR